MPTTKTNNLVSLIDRRLDVTHFREQHWEGTFWEYLDIVQENPAVARNAFQRVYDMTRGWLEAHRSATTRRSGRALRDSR